MKMLLVKGRKIQKKVIKIRIHNLNMYQARLIQTTILTVHLAEAKDKTCKNVVHNSSFYKSIHTSVKYYELDQIRFVRTTNPIQSNKFQGEIFDKSLNNENYECIYIFVLKAQS